MTARCWIVVVAVALGGCGGGEVHIRLVRGDCPDQSPGGVGGLNNINAVAVELIHRGPRVEYRGCKDTYGYPGDMAALEKQLRLAAIQFDVQSDGPWDLVIIGFDATTYCVTRPKPRPLLCGAAMGFSLPSNDTISVPVDCEFATADQTLKERIARCFAPVWPE